MNTIIDVHAHAFPDALARRAVQELATSGHERPRLDGTVSDLLASMDRSGVAHSVVACIATKPSQFEPILAWCKQIRSDRLVPQPSIHPADPDAAARVHQVAALGFTGLKLHPYYQDFDLDEPRLDPLYAAIAETRLLLALHNGHDCAFPGADRAGPERMARVLDRHPTLRVIATHLGGWRQWDAVEEHLLGRRVLLEVSMSLDLLTPERARDLLLHHPADCLLFGSDSPWRGQDETLAQVRALDLPPDTERALLGENARRELSLP